MDYTKIAIRLPERELAEWCRRWRVNELALFGSVLRPDFGPESDVDVLIAFEADVRWSLLDHIQMEQELSAILGRRVDLVSKRSIERSENWIRRRAILETAQVVYAA